jgi:hypothetical protein
MKTNIHAMAVGELEPSTTSQLPAFTFQNSRHCSDGWTPKAYQPAQI